MEPLYHVSEMGSDDSTEQDAPLMGVGRSPRVHALRGLAVVAGVLLLAAPFVALTNHNLVNTVVKADTGAVTELIANGDPCAAFSFLEFASVLNNNLGLIGPNKDQPEGIHIAGKFRSPGAAVQDVELHVNVKEGTSYAGTHQGGGNGIVGQFGSFTLHSGNSVSLIFSVFPPGTSGQIRANSNFNPTLIDPPMPKLDFSFFDLDSHAAEHSVEFVKVGNFKRAFVSKHSELVRTKEGSDLVFTASSQGNGDDNPTDPTILNDQQMNRAVTVEYEGFTQNEIIFGSQGVNSDGLLGRRFDFIARPSILCAEGASDGNGAVTISEDGEEADTMCCFIKMGPIRIMCADEKEKSWYHFMC